MEVTCSQTAYTRIGHVAVIPVARAVVAENYMLSLSLLLYLNFHRGRHFYPVSLCLFP